MTRDQTEIWRRYMVTTSSLRMMGARRVRPHTIPGGMDERGEAGEGGNEADAGRAEAGPGIEQVPSHEAMGHRLTRTGPVLWCVKCVAFAHLRHGSSFKETCKGFSDLGSRRVRRNRLMKGLHPLTGAHLGSGV